MRRMNVPSCPRASSQLKSAVRTLPTCKCPVGLGANLTRIIQLSWGPTPTTPGCGEWQHLLNQCNRVHRDRFVAAQRVDVLVRLSFDADGGHVDADRLREIRAHGGYMRRQLRTLGDDDGIDVRNRVSRGPDDRDRAFQQLDAVRAFPFRIGVGKVLADIARRLPRRELHRSPHDTARPRPNVRQGRSRAESSPLQ